MSDQNLTVEGKELNPELAGWLKVDNLGIDYPVMYKENDSTYYLTHNFKNEDSVSGSLFIAGESREGSRNIIIYGHNMTDGFMFGNLKELLSPEYKECELYFSSDKFGSGRYKLVTCFKTAIGESFDYYNYPNIQDEKTYESYTGYLKTYGAQVHGNNLITLSTCSYHKQDGRVVAVFEKINEVIP